jgi:predicted O-methyltransferase YrrM
VSITLLLSQDVGTFVALKTIGGMVMVGMAVGASTIWFKQALRNHNISVVAVAAS